jgi:hypothetical protein
LGNKTEMVGRSAAREDVERQGIYPLSAPTACAGGIRMTRPDMAEVNDWHRVEDVRRSAEAGMRARLEAQRIRDRQRAAAQWATALVFAAVVGALLWGLA